MIPFDGIRLEDEMNITAATELDQFLVSEFIAFALTVRARNRCVCR